MNKKYNRVLIKLSGEAIGKENGRDIDNDKLDKVVSQIIDISKSGAQVAVVIGAGNFWRGKYGAEYLKRTTSDYMGMLATVLNSLALRDMLESKGARATIMSSIEMKQVSNLYVQRDAIEYLNNGNIVIFAAGTGSPYFTTDTAAALRAVEIEADIILLAKNVDGVYNKDPMKYNDAIKYDNITHMEAITEKLGVMDTTALSLCMDNNMSILVFGLNEEDSIKKAICGEKIGTLVKS